jgi:hypothetical protein
MSVHYPTVPDNFKWDPPNNFGPYRKAPDEFGGEWWFVDPFTGQEPWKKVTPVSNIPPEFIAIFGPEPHFKHPFYQEWHDNLDDWIGPYTITNTANIFKLNHANELFNAFGMGNVAFYETKPGIVKARWPQCGHPEYDSWLDDVLNYPDIEVMIFQMRQVLTWGEKPERYHPFFPPHVIPEEHK